MPDDRNLPDGGTAPPHSARVKFASDSVRHQVDALLAESGGSLTPVEAEVLARTYATLLTDRLATKDDIALLRRDLAAQDEKFTAKFVNVRAEIAALEEKFDIKLSALEDRLNARITYSQLATIIILTAVIGAFNVWG